MNIDHTWMATEARLLDEADSLGDLLENLRHSLSPTLIAGIGWEALVARARGLPVSLAAFPFGFELPLHETRPDADFGISLVAGSRSGEAFEQFCRGRSAEPGLAGIARLLREKSRENSPLCRVTGTKMMLEYDIDPAATESPPAPGTFLYPTVQPLYGSEGRTRLADLQMLLDSVSATGWDWNEAERRQAEQAFLALPPEARIVSLGVFPARKRGVRLAVANFGTARHIIEYLQRVSWPGCYSSARSLLSRLLACDPTAKISVHLTIRADGVGQSLGLSLYPRDSDWLKQGRYWLDNPAHWTALMEDLAADPMVAPGKVPALADWSSGAIRLFGKSGAFVLIRGIHHVKFVAVEDRVEQIKAYVFLMMCAVSKDGTAETASQPRLNPH